MVKLARAVALGMATLSLTTWGCSTRQLAVGSQLSQDTRETIAECTGGISEQAERELAAAVGRRSGQLIAESNYEVEPGKIFTLGEVKGETAVEMYNAYVECLDRKQRTHPQGVEEPAPRWRYHNIRELPGGEIVVQTPLPSETRYGDEIQLQIVTEKEHWASQERPYWTSRCGEFWAEVTPIGSPKLDLRDSADRRVVTHGFRTTFCVWAAEVDCADNVVVDCALAHGPRSRTQAAYRRTTAFDRRVGLMQRWADYVVPQS